MSDEIRELWEKLDDESGQAYAAFCLYRDQGVPHSKDRAWRQAKGASAAPDSRADGTWDRWSVDYNWVARAIAWDTHLDLLARKAREDAAAAESAEFRERVLARSRRFAKSLTRLETLASKTLHLVGKRQPAGDVVAKATAHVQACEDVHVRRFLADAVKAFTTGLPVRMLPSTFRTIAVLSDVQLNHEAEALGIRQIEAILDEDEG